MEVVADDALIVSGQIAVGVHGILRIGKASAVFVAVIGRTVNHLVGGRISSCSGTFALTVPVAGTVAGVAGLLRSVAVSVAGSDRKSVV